LSGFAGWGIFRNSYTIEMVTSGYVYDPILSHTVVVIAIVIGETFDYDHDCDYDMSPVLRELVKKNKKTKTRYCRIVTQGDTVALRKALLVYGTRPEAIKMAPVAMELRGRPDRFAIHEVVTGQHREMLDQVLHLFGLVPDYDLNVMVENQTPADVVSATVGPLGEIFRQEAPSVVLVQGDTTTTLAAALAAFYCGIPLGHVEAGLRTRDRKRPFPEEMNRRLTSVVVDLHFAPTESARQNLLQDGVKADAIWVTGNTVIDALMMVARRQDYTLPKGLDQLVARSDRRLLLVTAHRRENLGPPMENICRALVGICNQFQDVEIVFSVHRNPRVRETVYRILHGEGRIHLIEPLDYEPFVHLMDRSHLILTDSGGIQEEAPSLGKPVLVLREVTERPEAVEAGTVRLVGLGTETILETAALLLTDGDAYRRMSLAHNPYGDGKAARRIADILESKL
jgi:UDP-N-acetylglucosamine 2-epimerase (non-hydrolysing)